MTTHNLLPLGRITRLQIQRSSLKRGQKPNRVFDPAPLLEVSALTLSASGAVALLPDGSALLDVHHALHPLTRNSDGVNDLSVGFTGHYARMRERYGDRLVDGCAGENILVDNAAQIDMRHRPARPRPPVCRHRRVAVAARRARRAALRRVQHLHRRPIHPRSR